MKTISRIIFWTLSLVVIFILINLAIGLFKYKSISNYTNFLDQKDWNKYFSKIEIKNPMSIFNLFYGDYIISQKETVLDDQEIINSIVDGDIDSQEEISINVYDPEFEDDFNEFFGKTKIEGSTGDESYENPGFITPDDGFVLGDSDGDEPSVVKQLLDKLNQ